MVVMQKPLHLQQRNKITPWLKKLPYGMFWQSSFWCCLPMVLRQRSRCITWWLRTGMVGGKLRFPIRILRNSAKPVLIASAIT